MYIILDTLRPFQYFILYKFQTLKKVLIFLKTISTFNTVKMNATNFNDSNIIAYL